MKKTIILLALAACVERKPMKWSGIPDGVQVACEEPEQYQRARSCPASNGVLYTCVRTQDADREPLMLCARAVPALMPAPAEAP